MNDIIIAILRSGTPLAYVTLAGVLARGPRRIRLDMLRTLSADALIDALNDGLEANNSAAVMTAIRPREHTS